MSDVHATIAYAAPPNALWMPAPASWALPPADSQQVTIVAPTMDHAMMNQVRGRMAEARAGAAQGATAPVLIHAVQPEAPVPLQTRASSWINFELCETYNFEIVVHPARHRLRTLLKSAVRLVTRVPSPSSAPGRPFASLPQSLSAAVELALAEWGLPPRAWTDARVDGDADGKQRILLRLTAAEQQTVCVCIMARFCDTQRP